MQAPSKISGSLGGGLILADCLLRFCFDLLCALWNGIGGRGYFRFLRFAVLRWRWNESGFGVGKVIELSPTWNRRVCREDKAKGKARQLVIGKAGKDGTPESRRRSCRCSRRLRCKTRLLPRRRKGQC